MPRRLLIGTLAVVLLCVGAGLAVRGCGGAPLPRLAAGGRTVLDVDLEASYPEGPPSSGLSTLFSPPRTTLRELVETIDRAGADASVAGLVARVGSGPAGLARAQEIRDAIRRFRARGKFAWAWAETFGEGGNGTVGFYLACGFDQIWLQPSGDLWITGVALETPFFRGTLDKLGVEPQFEKRREYKNAPNSYTERELTPAHREALEKLKDSWFAQLVRGIASGRKVSEDAVRGVIDRAPLLGTEAVQARFVDGLGYRDEVVRKALSKAGNGADLVSFSRYRRSLPSPAGKGSIALVYGVGEVVRGRSAEGPFLGSVTMGSDSVSAAIRSAVEDSSIRAIVFRVDSPGGSYVASDTIWREVNRARDRGKPVIVSMGDVAGSGGYFVAIGADKIVAQPGTITGSIGVFAGKFVLSGLFEKIGLSFGEVHSGEHALLWDTTREFTPSERDRFDAWLDRIYADFTSKVAAGRKLPRDRVLEIARGRIWSGEDARGLGLVDELGGMDEAIKLAQRAAHIPLTERVHLEVFPRPRTFWDTAGDRFFGRHEEPDDDADADTLIAAMRAIGPVARRLHAWGVDSRNGVLRAPDVKPDSGDR